MRRAYHQGLSPAFLFQANVELTPPKRLLQPILNTTLVVDHVLRDGSLTQATSATPVLPLYYDTLR